MGFSFIGKSYYILGEKVNNMDYAKESLRLHGEWKGKIEVIARAKVKDKEALSPQPIMVIRFLTKFS